MNLRQLKTNSKNLDTLLLLSLLTGLIIGCGVPKQIQQNFIIRYENKDTGLDTMMNMQGYYVIVEPKTKREYKSIWSKEYKIVADTFYMNYLFFRDGMYLRNFGFRCSSPTCVPQIFEKMVNDSLGKERHSFSVSSDWGVYRRSGDTIITNYINNPSSPKVWFAGMEKFRIVNRNTIIQIDSKPLEKMSKSDWVNWEESQKNQNYQPAIFIPLKTLPSSDSWLKNELWFWVNDSLRINYLSKNGG